MNCLAVGMESGAIPKENVIASSSKSNSKPSGARFNADWQGWAPYVNHPSYPHWLQVELNKQETLTHVATQGNTPAKTYSYCKLYMIHYRKSSETSFIVYKENHQPRVSFISAVLFYINRFSFVVNSACLTFRYWKIRHT